MRFSDGSRARMFGGYQAENIVARNCDGEALGAGLKPAVAPLTRHVEPPRAATSIVRKTARSILTASFTLAALAGAVALQAAVHVYVLRLTG